MHVVATAGHVDHGKSTLVQALTGADPDRLEEEKRRGLSIRLGYCWTRLDPVGEVAFVDVPGHERFLATTLAGLGPAPAVMLVVAADDPWMPQAEEHLTALDAMGVQHGVLVVTRADLADPAPALAAARDRLAATSLADAPAVVVSGRTGQGLAELRAALAGMLADVPAPDPAAPVRLWVDRRFHVRGTGTVVTGTLRTGSLEVGRRLRSNAGEVRVRALQCLDRPVDAVRAPARVALDLGGGVPAGLDAGSALVEPGAFDEVVLVDVRLTGGGTPPEQPLLHLGSHASTVHHRRIGEGLARLHLSAPLPLRLGDRALLRDPGSRTLWGVRVLDTDPAPFRRRGAAGRRAHELGAFDDTVATQLLSRGVVHRDSLRRRGARDTGVPEGTVAGGDWLVSPGRAAVLRARLADEVADATDHRGLTLAAAARVLGVDDPGVVEALVAAPLRLRDGRVVGPRHDELPDVAARALRALEDDLAAAPFAAPPADRLTELGLSGDTLGLLASRDLVLRLADAVVLMPGADDRAAAVLAGLPQPFTVSEARRALSTSRRVALPLLALLDRRGHTVRLADDSRRMRSAAP